MNENCSGSASPALKKGRRTYEWRFLHNNSSSFDLGFAQCAIVLQGDGAAPEPNQPSLPVQRIIQLPAGTASPLRPEDCAGYTSGAACRKGAPGAQQSAQMGAKEERLVMATCPECRKKWREYPDEPTQECPYCGFVEEVPEEEGEGR